MTRSIDRALELLRDKMRARGVLTIAERVCEHHGVTLLDVASFAEAGDKARRDVFRALRDRGITMRQLASWFSAELDEVGELLVGDRYQLARIDAALGLGLS
jgi:hypothetical protein